MSKRLVSSRLVIWVLLGALALWSAAWQEAWSSDTESGLEIVSPSHPATLNVCECPKMTQRLSWDSKVGMLEGKVSYNTVPGLAVPANGAVHPQTFILGFPTVYRSARDELYVEAKNQKVVIGVLKESRSGRLKVQMDPGVSFVEHRVEGNLGGEIVVSPSASAKILE